MVDVAGDAAVTHDADRRSTRSRYLSHRSGPRNSVDELHQRSPFSGIGALEILARKHIPTSNRSAEGRNYRAVRHVRSLSRHSTRTVVAGVSCALRTI